MLRFLLCLFVLETIPAFAAYDGKLADDPYHHSPTWLYILVGGILLYAISIAISKGVSTKTRKKTSRNQHPIQSSAQTGKKVYKEYGRYCDICPDCKGRGNVQGKEIYYSVGVPQTVTCEACKGYGHILNDEAKVLYVNLEKVRCKEKNIQRERNKLSKENPDNPYGKVSLSTLMSMFPETQKIVVSEELESDRINKKINEIVQQLPYCSQCSAHGYLSVEVDCDTGRAYERIACKRCNGRGRLYYD